MSAMAPFADFTTLCARLVSTASRLGKRRLVAEYLRALPPDDVPNAVAFLTGRPFPVSDPRVLNVRGLPAPGGAASGPPLTLADVVAAFAQVAEAAGAGARRLKEQCLSALAVRASDAEREVIARIQVHGDGQRVGIWSRRLSDVTASLPDVVDIVRRDLAGAPFILDGEVVALDAAGRPLPFQELMRRFRRVHDVEALVGEVPLALHFFDCLVAEGRSLIDEPSERRWEALKRVTGGRYLAERSVVTTVSEADAFLSRALAAGHEGVMAKDQRAAYEPGGRGKRWFKLKAADPVDCVIIAADRGSGRRVGWLSNYHLAVRDGEGWADVGKTFKGLTDQEFTAMTERLWALAVGDDGYTVRVRPEVVVEVEYNEIQKSPTYPSGLALRFARIARIRDDKAPGQATTLAQLRDLYEAQFRTKGRAG